MLALCNEEQDKDALRYPLHLLPIHSHLYPRHSLAFFIATGISFCITTVIFFIAAVSKGSRVSQDQPQVSCYADDQRLRGEEPGSDWASVRAQQLRALH